MSSHHFVKEGQEPALFIVDPISFELAQPLLEWAPLVIVLESALDEVMRWGIKVDVVLTAHNEVAKIKEQVIDQIPIKIISYATGDDPIATAFYFLLSSKQTGVNIIVDSLNKAVFTFIQNSSPKLNIVLLNKNLKWSLIVGGEYRKWFPAKMLIKILGSADGQVFSTEGIDPRNQEYYEVREDGQIIIRSKSNFWIGEEIEITERHI